MKILIIEDEKKVAIALKEGLTNLEFEAETAFSGEEGFFLLNTKKYDLLILDIMLPGRDGIEILKALRNQGNNMPVLLLTAKDAIEDRVLGLESGADDYLVKPFAFPELTARIRVLLRRGNTDLKTRLTLAGLEMDLLARKVSRDQKPINLTGKEFELLEYLLKHTGCLVSREMLAKDVWHETLRATPIDNVIDVHITRLRKKIDGPFETKLLHTIRGLGFKMEVHNS